MSQGLCLFDAAPALVVLNARFADMCGVLGALTCESADGPARRSRRRHDMR